MASLDDLWEKCLNPMLKSDVEFKQLKFLTTHLFLFLNAGGTQPSA